MRSTLQKELIACFKHEFEQHFPQFKCMEAGDEILIWEWNRSANLTFFVVLQPFERRDQFTVEIAWSESGEFPWKRVNRMKIEEPQGRRRLARLWATGSEEPVWDLAPEQTAADEEDMQRRLRGLSRTYPPDPPVDRLLPRVCPLVKDAVEKLVQYGIPLFRRVAEHRGLIGPMEPRVVV